MDLTDKATTTVDEAAQVLGVSRATAYAAVHAGEIPAIRVGRRLLVPTAWLRRELDPEAPDQRLAR